MKPIPQVGQTLYSLNVGNSARNVQQILTPVIVRKVGRKYFECSKKLDDYFVTQYHLDTWREKTEYTPDSELYENPQDWEDQNAAVKIAAEIRDHFSRHYRPVLPLDKLRQIRDIINS